MYLLQSHKFLLLTLLSLALLGAVCARKDGAKTPSLSQPASANQTTPASVQTTTFSATTTSTPTSSTTSQVDCPLTVPLVRSRCKIPDSIKLDSGNALTTGKCSIVVKGPYGEPYRVLSFHQDSTIKIEVGEAPQPLDQAGVKKRAIAQVRGYTAAKPVAEDITGLGDYAFWIRHPLQKNTEDYRRGYRGEAFSLYTVAGTQQGRLISGGANVYAVQAKGKSYEKIGAGCDLEEVKTTAKEVVLPLLIKTAQQEKSQEEALARQKKEEVERARKLAKEKCLPLAEVAKVCRGEEQPTDVQAFAGGEEGIKTITCQYNASLDKGTQKALQGVGAPIKERPYLQTAVSNVLNQTAANLTYTFAIKPFVNAKDIVGRNEIGSKSLRTKTALGFATKSKVVVITELNRNKTCKPEQLLPFGKLLLTR